MTKNENHDSIIQFVRQISRLNQDSECQTCNKSGDDENPACSDHEAWNMPVDDAFETVGSLISRARHLVATLKL